MVCFLNELFRFNGLIKGATVVVNTVKSAASSVMNNPYLKGIMSGGIRLKNKV